MVHLKKLILDILGVNSSLNKVYSSFNLDTELGKTNPVAALTSGKITKDDIGKTVYLSNSYTTCQEWRIADINHDNTSGTVDLWPKYVLHMYRSDATPYSYVFSASEDEIYEYSSVRTILNSYIYNGFASDIQSAIKTQSFKSDGSSRTLYDKVKCPSIEELGYHRDDTQYPGTKYALFDDVDAKGSSSITLYTTFGATAEGNFYHNKPITYWTRTLAYSKYVWVISEYGSGDISEFTTNYVGVSNSLAAIIRF